MAIPHASPGQVIDVRPLGASLRDATTSTLVKTARLEVIRLMLPKGKQIPGHQVPGEITVHCLEGSIEFTVQERALQLEAGQMLFVTGGEEHSLRGLEDASVLVTILL
jgi:quercetin dioxygenase-like cupin family protein